MGVSRDGEVISILGWWLKIFVECHRFYFLGFGADFGVYPDHLFHHALYRLCLYCSFGRWRRFELPELSELLAQEGVESGLRMLD